MPFLVGTRCVPLSSRVRTFWARNTPSRKKKKKEVRKMGITIHYALGVWDERALEDNLTRVAALARGMGMKASVSLEKEKKVLEVDPHERCETLYLAFTRLGEGEERHWAINTKELEGMWFATGSCKTQFAGPEVHARVAELLRAVASKCSVVYINDEGDYYESGDGRRAEEAIRQNGLLIDLLAEVLREKGVKVVTGAELLDQEKKEEE